MERRVTVEIVPPLHGGLQRPEDPPDFVDGPLHGGPDVGHDDRGDLPVEAQRLLKVLQVHRPAGDRPDHDALQPQKAQQRGDGIMGVLGEVHEGVGIKLPGEEEPVQVTLRPPTGHIPSVAVRRGVKEVREEPDYLYLEFVSVEGKRRREEGISQVVDRIAEKAVERLVIEQAVAGISRDA